MIPVFLNFKQLSSRKRGETEAGTCNKLSKVDLSARTHGHLRIIPAFEQHGLLREGGEEDKEDVVLEKEWRGGGSIPGGSLAGGRSSQQNEEPAS